MSCTRASSIFEGIFIFVEGGMKKLRIWVENVIIEFIIKGYLPDRIGKYIIVDMILEGRNENDIT